MRKRELTLIRDRLLVERRRIMSNARDTLESINHMNPDDLNDEVDLATVEQDETVAFRLRDREALLLAKIEQTLAKLKDDGEAFGCCDNCGSEIGLKRLMVRPVATLCIQCKEEQEQIEQGYAN